MALFVVMPENKYKQNKHKTYNMQVIHTLTAAAAS